jgi:hypothetical protein
MSDTYYFITKPQDVRSMVTGVLGGDVEKVVEIFKPYQSGKQTHNEKRERNISLTIGYLLGIQISVLSANYGITISRVSQIIKKTGRILRNRLKLTGYNWQN